MDCPSCGRALAAGARTCVYCAHGNTFKRPQPLAVPEGSTGYRKGGIAWGRWFLILLVVAGLVVWFTPSLHEKVQPLIDKVKSLF